MAHSSSSVFIGEAYEKTGANVVSVYSPDFELLCDAGKGQELVFEAKLSEGKVRWCEDKSDMHYYSNVHPDTRWIRVIRASEGRLLTWRCYRQRPPADGPLQCPKGHTLHKSFGTSGFFRMVASTHHCAKCNVEVRKGGFRWVCDECDYDLCCTCGEASLWQMQHGARRASAPDAPAGVGPPGAARIDLSSPKVGDRVECFSVSQGAWLPAAVRHVGDGLVTVLYTAPDGSQHQKRLPIGSEQLRPSAVRATGEGASAPGSSPEGGVFSSMLPSGGSPGGSPASFGQPRQAFGLQGVPGIGLVKPEQLRDEALQRAQRLAQHGDVLGLQRQLARARQLGVQESELERLSARLERLRGEGELGLLLAPSGGA
eukprot:TRINITY_DN38390_c0_g1_i1.p1 TRINITY_DN38390_c0_g1~~TRINITY_DN38390_c0_g1_i1.p1  ORF type:complete len:388 (+),score=95.95 TRINITY_DN38390_c0_g1_i1:52-1164(+)